MSNFLDMAPAIFGFCFDVQALVRFYSLLRVAMESEPHSRNTGSSQEPLVYKCRRCGQMTAMLYQENTCKDCLIKNFTELRKVINFHRSPEGRLQVGQAG